MVSVTFKLPGGKKVDITDTPTDGQVVTFNDGKDQYDAQDSGTGTVTSASNVGVGDGWFKQLTGTDLEFKTVITTSPLATTSNANDLTLTIDNISFTLLADGTDGELITWDSNGVPAAVAVGTSGQVLTSNGVGAAPTFQAAGGAGLTFAKVVKSADETINTDIVLSDDSELTFTPSINKTYLILFFLRITSGTVPDFKQVWSVPTGATMNGLRQKIWRNDALSNSGDFTSSFNISTDGTPEIMTFWAVLIMSSTAGDATFQWAQQASSAENTTVHQGSTIVVWEEA